ncbi:MAG TPA: MBL fold metallo-hydrolase [Tepidisphaeraceae bacterium]|nr:MBL fold metallo-hydrolase [Tepidisphaeraceae bacterium]
MSWRTYTDFLKRKQFALRLAAGLGRGRGGMRWLDQVNPPARAPMAPNLAGWEDRELSAVWIGHATVLLRVGGMTILTDPVFGNRVGLGLWLTTLGPRRQIAAAMQARQLPKIDLILISHAHFDHLDRQSLAALNKKTAVVTAHDTRDLVWDLGFRNVTELRWGERARFNGLAITARQVQHWGARTFIDQHRGYNGYLLESSRRRVLYGGDTAYQEWFKDVGPVNLAILGIGAYDPYIHAHATPEQAWTMANHARAEFVLPMHHSTFRLSHEPMNEPLERILAATGRESERIAVREVGGTWTAN